MSLNINTIREKVTTSPSIADVPSLNIAII
jgi:hypothetical protein